MLGIEPKPSVYPRHRPNLAALRAHSDPRPVDEHEAHELQRDPEHNPGFRPPRDENCGAEFRGLKNREGQRDTERGP